MPEGSAETNILPVTVGPTTESSGLLPPWVLQQPGGMEDLLSSGICEGCHLKFEWLN
jgi:hypothetical protein